MLPVPIMTPSDSLAACDPGKRTSVFLMVVFWTGLPTGLVLPSHYLKDRAGDLAALHWVQPIPAVTHPQPHNPVFPKPGCSTSLRDNHLHPCCELPPPTPPPHPFFPRLAPLVP